MYTPHFTKTAPSLTWFKNCPLLTGKCSSHAAPRKFLFAMSPITENHSQLKCRVVDLSPRGYTQRTTPAPRALGARWKGGHGQVVRARGLWSLPGSCVSWQGRKLYPKSLTYMIAWMWAKQRQQSRSVKSMGPTLHDCSQLRKSRGWEKGRKYRLDNQRQMVSPETTHISDIMHSVHYI